MSSILGRLLEAVVESIVGIAGGARVLSISRVGSSLERRGYRDVDVVAVVREDSLEGFTRLVWGIARRLRGRISSLGFELKVVVGGYTSSYKWPANILSLHIYKEETYSGRRLGIVPPVPNAVRYSWSLASERLYGAPLASLADSRPPTLDEVVYGGEGVVECIESIRGRRHVWYTVDGGALVERVVRLDDYSLGHRIRYCVVWNTVNLLRALGHHRLWPGEEALKLARAYGLDHRILGEALAGGQLEPSRSVEYLEGIARLSGG